MTNSFKTHGEKSNIPTEQTAANVENKPIPSRTNISGYTTINVLNKTELFQI